MAIYHLEAKVVSRGAGRSAVAAAAYISCCRMLNDYDGVQHDYTRKQGLVWQRVFLPPMAPVEWQDREKLWNAVEATEKAKDSRLAREFVVALPVELNRKDRIALLEEFIQSNFVADGMCADAALHDTDGHNPHAHILLTVRPLKENGTWQYKTEKEYLCLRNDEERGFTAGEYMAAQADGWEKQYQYRAGKKKEFLAPSEAEAHGYERLSKYPKSTKFGRQNPISERWNSDEQLLVWREAWADIANKYLTLYPWVDERIDHRSHAVRGIDEQPTIHEGVIARAMEQKGVVSDRCELNRQIKADNKLLRELKVQVERLVKAVRGTISAIAEAIETVRKNMLIFHYQRLHTRASKRKVTDTLDAVLPNLNRYTEIVGKLKTAIMERKSLLSEKKAASILNVPKQMELSRKIATLTKDIEELRNGKNMLLGLFDKSGDDGMKEIRQWVDSIEASLQRLEQAEGRYNSELDTALAQYRDLRNQASGLDAGELHAARMALRLGKTADAVDQLKTAYGRQYDYSRMQRAERDIAAMLGGEVETPSIRQQLRELSNKQEPRQRKPKSKEHGQER